MSGSLSHKDYARFIEADYLHRYIVEGGSTVKVVIAEDVPRSKFADELSDRAKGLDYLCVSLTSANVRINRLEALWFAIANQIDWLDLGRRFLASVLFPRFELPDEDFSIEAIARKNGLERWVVQKALDEILHARLVRQKGLSGEFRRAMFNVVGSLLAPVGVVASATPFVLEWLCGTLTSIVPVKQAMLYRKITKTNGRQMLVSLPRWLRNCKIPGLLLTIDIANVTDADRSLTSFNYTKASRIDSFEVIRQFIDTTDSVDGLGLWFVAEPAFADDERRGMHIYPALEMRLAQDINDSKRPNPFASMVRVS